MADLVIVESPAKAKTIEKFLGDGFTVLASMGHIRDLPTKELGIDVSHNFEPRYVVPQDKGKTVALLKSTIKKIKPTKIYVATDEDREGEAIGWHLLQTLDIIDAKYERIVFHEITRSAILDALKNPRKIDTHLVNAQQARRLLDRLVGYKLSPLLWKKIARGLSAGRVQSVAVRLIVEREREIRNFVPQEYWKIIAKLQHDISFSAELHRIQEEIVKIPSRDGKTKGKIIQTKKEAFELTDIVRQSKNFIVKTVDVKKGTKNPSPPFITSTLQQEASRKLGFSVKQTMVIAQKLYEGVEISSGRTGLITYMRTDSVNLSEHALTQAKETITNLYGPEYTLTEPRRFKTKTKGAQEAHEAIRPVNMKLTPEEVSSHLDRNELRLYELIWKRTIACQMKEASIENTIITLYPEKNPELEFITKGETILFPGFIKVYTEGRDEEDEEGTRLLPKLAKNDTCYLEDLTPDQYFTKPESRYTEASLVKKLESEGIGRPSTYAPTISTIIDRKYIEKKEKFLHPTEMGEVVTDFLIQHFSDIVDYTFTASMEEELDTIAEGKTDWTKMMKNFYTPFEKNLEKKEKELQKYQEKTDEKCEKCGSEMVIKLGRYGKFLSCSNYPTCKNIKSLHKEEEQEASIKTDEKCEKCSASLIIKKGRFGNFLACENYPTCKFTKPILKTVGMKCPDCKTGDIIERKTKKFRTFYGCSGYPSCTFMSWKKPIKTCTCGGIMVENGKKGIKCITCAKEESPE